MNVLKKDWKEYLYNAKKILYKHSYLCNDYVHIEHWIENYLGVENWILIRQMTKRKNVHIKKDNREHLDINGNIYDMLLVT